MNERSAPLINGIINSLSIPLKYIEPGMLFHFDGKTLHIFPYKADEDTKNIWLYDVLFDNFFEDPLDSSNGDILVNCTTRPTGDSITFHVAGKPGGNENEIKLSVLAYWTIDNSYELSDVSSLHFTGLCIDSFNPMTNIQFRRTDEYSEIAARASSQNSIDLGTAHICNTDLTISSETTWRYEPMKGIGFKSFLICNVHSLDYTLLKSIYTNITSTIQFCLGRNNTNLAVELYTGDEANRHTIGTFAVPHDKTSTPDELDEAHACFPRAKDIGLYFGIIVTAFSNSVLNAKELALSRHDANIITYAKIIELTSSFEKEFRELYPEGVKHRTKTLREMELAKQAIMEAAEKLTSQPKRILTRLSERIDEDSLDARIRYSVRTLSKDVSTSVFKSTGININYSQLGKKITELRNDIAHGNKPRHKLKSVTDEYKLLVKLILAMRLMRLEIPEGEIARIVRSFG